MAVARIQYTPKGAMRGRNLGSSSPPQKVSPFKEIGTSGVAVFGGQVMNREKDVRVSGPQRWITFQELVTNTSIVAAGVRYFLNIAAHAKWSVVPANQDVDKDPAPEAEEAAELVDSVINDMVTPWRRVVRRASMYRFNGYGIQEWTAKKRVKDGKIGLEDIEARPCHTMDRWEVDEKGSVLGIWQRSPQTGELLYLPRTKTLYLVEDSLTDNPEGLGLYRHLVEPYERLKKYLTLEGHGFERDLRGIPIGRVPYTAIKAAVDSGAMTTEDAKAITSAIENFVKIQSKQEDTSLVLDSAPYVVETDSGQSLSGIMQYGIELLQGQQPGFAELNVALARLNQEMARIIGVEHLLLGGEGGANRALSEDKSRNFYLTVNGTLDDVTDGCEKDIVNTICDLNGIKEEFRPKLKHSDVSFRAVTEIAAVLAQIAAAGGVLQPDDPAIDTIRDMLGLPDQPEITPEMKGLLMGAFGGAKPGEKDEEGKDPNDPNAKPGENKGFPPKPGEKEEEEEEEEVPPKGKRPNPFASKGKKAGGRKPPAPKK